MKKKLSLCEKKNYKNILNYIGIILFYFELFGQYEIISYLLDLLDKNNDEAFIKELNSVNMWGGAGAVWEVGIPQKEVRIIFDRKLIELIDLMESTDVLGRGIKSLKKLLIWSINKEQC